MRSLLANLDKTASESPDSGAEVVRACSFKVADKGASFDDHINETEEDKRARRVGEFLRRRQPTGLQDGSASPTPPKDTTP